ncbi:MAG: hypothetical protein M3N30_07310 [Bacteroidota bacterium]|nr:hypothetical protein [Bacteroidota bacterium]
MTRNVVAAFILSFLLPCLLKGQNKSYQFDGNGISREVLENYLERAITMVYLLIPERPEGNSFYPYRADDTRMLKNIGAKFIGRSIYRWGGEKLLNNPAFWDSARSIISNLHVYDPDIIFQVCLFEIVTEEVNEIGIPEWVFRAYGLPAQTRNFSYNAMLNPGNARMPYDQLSQ